MKRTKLRDRILPNYTKGEERFNTISHIVGGGFGILALLSCVLVSIFKGNIWSVVGSSIYGASMVALYTVSSVYHGLTHPTAKKVMQVIDHCTIYLLIGGTYTPILLSAIRPVSPGWAWTIFGIVWGLAALAITFTAIDLKKYAVFSMVCYIGMGWCILIAAKTILKIFLLRELFWLLLGGILYTVGAVLYGLGKRIRYMHAIFHLFVLAGSITHYVFILHYVI